MKDLKIIKKVFKNTIVSATALLLMRGGVNATSVDSGNLVINLDQEVFNSFGVPGGVNTVIEHYYDQPTGNSLTGSQILTNDLDLLEISGDYSNLNFGMNEFHDKLGPIIGELHQLQGTDFEFSDSDVSAPSGQLGIGGLLRLSFPVAGTAIDAGFGVIAIGDFTLSFGDRNEGASGWLFKTTTGLPEGLYYPLWDTTGVALSTE